MNQSAKLKIYYEDQWLPPNPKRAHNFLAPLLFQGEDAEPGSPASWETVGTNKIVRMEHPEEADLVCLPDLYSRIDPTAVKQAACLADRHDKHFLAMEHCDHYEPPAKTAKKTLLFHSDLYRSRRQPNHYVHPTLLIADMLPTLYLPENGWTPYPWERRIRVFWRGACDLYTLPKWKTAMFYMMDNWRRVRHEALQALLYGPDITLISTLSNQWWKSDPSDQFTRKRLFVQEALDSPYALITRGSGNYSFRLYEIMALGRIPVIIDTDSCLPWPDLIPWSEICLIVPRKDIPKLPSKIREFHEGLTCAEFEALQYRIREIWQTYLSEEGFYTTLCDQLSGLITRPEVLTAHSRQFAH
ncbi:MAG TPA: exostosin family protein [Coleofasciculaceae cyanobacterium]|jgi:hypothetical protein